MSSLPGIVHNQPDVYESEDPEPVPSSSRHNDDSTSGAVEQLPSGVRTAYGRFSDRLLDSRFTDFGNPYGHGLRTELSDYEKLLMNRENETVTERLERLTMEVAELAEDVNSIKEADGGSESTVRVNPAELSSEVAALQKQISTLSLDAAARGGAERSQMGQYLLQAMKKDPAVAGQEGGGGGVTYELYCRQDGDRTASSGELQDLAERLSKLESAVGTDELRTGKVIPAGLHAYTPTKDLATTVMALQSRVALLDQGQIMEADIRLKSLLSTLQKVKSAQKGVPEEEQSKKIDELYELVKKWDTERELLPDLIDRLVTLKDVHSRGASLVNSVTELEAAQQGIKAELAALRDAVKQAQASFADNLSTIQANFAAIEAKTKK